MTVRSAGRAIPLGVRELTADECWKLLATNDLGRLAVRAGSGVEIFPLNYLVHAGAVYFRSAPGSKLIDLTRAPEVAFEIDGQAARHVWSVVISGTAARLGSDDEIVESGIHNLAAWYPSEKLNYVRVQPLTVTGRSFAKPQL